MRPGVPWPSFCRTARWREVERRGGVSICLSAPTRLLTGRRTHGGLIIGTCGPVVGRAPLAAASGARPRVPPPKPGRRGGPGRNPVAAPGGTAGRRTTGGDGVGATAPGNAVFARRGSPSDRPSVSSHSNPRHTSPDTTPIRSRACRRAPRRSASSRPPDASARPSSHHTTHNRASPDSSSPKQYFASCSPPGRHIPTGPRSATGTSLPRGPDFALSFVQRTAGNRPN